MKPDFLIKLHITHELAKFYYLGLILFIQYY